MHEGRYTIGTLSKLTGIPLDTIRHYTELQLLHPITEGSYRYYSNDDIYVLYHIRSFRQIGFSLAQISEMLKAGSEPEVQDPLKERIREREESIARAQNELAYMRGLLQETDNCFREERMVKENEHVSFAYIRQDAQGSSSKELLDAWVNAIPFAQPHLMHNTRTSETQAGGFAMFPGYTGYVNEKYELFMADHALSLYLLADEINDAFDRAQEQFDAFAGENGYDLDPVIHCFILRARLKDDHPLFMVRMMVKYQESS
ncbi:MAG: MerR family transcriptional regulator [Bulleidia sp.]|nr:MerR family transcriptional regulator [Bulleidia sp.]